MKFGGNLGSVIEKIENENSVCVVESLWRTWPTASPHQLVLKSDPPKRIENEMKLT